MKIENHKYAALETTDWKIETVDILDFPIDIRISEARGQIQFIINNKLRKAFGSKTIEEVMLKNEVLDLCNEIKKQQQLFPIYNE